MKGRPLRKDVAQDEESAEHQSQAVEKMCGGSRGPDFVRIDASNENLAVGEFHKPVEIGLDIRKCQALRQEYNRPIVACEGARQRIIVADGILPFVQHSRLLEGTPADRGASAPAKVFPLLAQHRNYGGIPSRE